MNQEVKKKWIDALRSGEYKQTKGRLKDDNGYCCLGVLCELFSKEIGTIQFLKLTPYISSDLSVYSFNDARNFPPQEVKEWAGVEIIDGLREYSLIKYNEKTCSLASLNDKGISFKEIANIIEEQL